MEVKRQIAAAVLALAIGAAVAALLVLERRSPQHVVEARFWFDDVAFDFPIRRQGLESPMTGEETGVIRSVALAEIRTAYEGLRVTFSENGRGFYRVQVIDQYAPRAGPPGPAGKSRPMGVFGGEGTVSFRAVAGHAIHYAPPGLNRQAIVEGIGRGIGRTAVHEFAHQILFGAGVPQSTDIRSYEYESADRAGQYYGSMRWDTAWPFLVKKLGR